MNLPKNNVVCWFALLAVAAPLCRTHDSKDFDDSILYKIEFDMPDFEKNPDFKNNLRTFHTLDREKYSCVIPVVDDVKEEKKTGGVQISPLKLISPTFSATSCSYRIEAYWSYEICHGYHIRQYHEEREGLRIKLEAKSNHILTVPTGKSIKFQEYYLGKWSEDKSSHLSKVLEEQSRAGIKHKTTKIDGIRYPYFEMEMTDGTPCDIINEPRTTKIRYVCYPHGKNEIYSFKETSSCNYEAIILTSLLCIDPVFHPEESKEVSIKCFNADAAETHKPLSMLRQELQELQQTDTDYPVPKSNSLLDNNFFVNKYNAEVDKLVQELMEGAGVTLESTISIEDVTKAVTPPPIIDLAPIKELLTGKTCLTGGTGWWKYEFCHRVHVRQFHKDKKSDDEIFLGYFDESAHRLWIQSNPDKAFKKHRSTSIWHHYEGGLQCDRTGKPREVDVKLTCAPVTTSPTAVTMYLLEPKTCQYILVVESPIICDLMHLTDEYGFVDVNKFDKLLQESNQTEQPPVNEGDSSSVAADNPKENVVEHDDKVVTEQLNPSGATGSVRELPATSAEESSANQIRHDET